MVETPFMKFLLATACIVIIVAGIKAISSALIIVLFRGSHCAMHSPADGLAPFRKMSSMMAVIITVMVVIIVGVAIISIVGSAVNGIRQKLPEYSVRISALSSGVVES
jgi:predicted PurR-regulated permease PerM